MTDIFLCPGFNSASCSTGGFFARTRQADHSHLSITDLKNVWSYSSILQYVIIERLVWHRHNSAVNSYRNELQVFFVEPVKTC